MTSSAPWSSDFLGLPIVLNSSHFPLFPILVDFIVPPSVAFTWPANRPKFFPLPTFPNPRRFHWFLQASPSISYICLSRTPPPSSIDSLPEIGNTTVAAALQQSASKLRSSTIDTQQSAASIHKIQEALGALGKMEKRGLDPDIVTYSIIWNTILKGPNESKSTKGYVEQA
ncbi:hypothetical protein L1887_15378 [Cichorium endivia]|nr:hypothetical protein L1887_15378 [Cichorium endivia]